MCNWLDSWVQDQRLPLAEDLPSFLRVAPGSSSLKTAPWDSHLFGSSLSLELALESESSAYFKSLLSPLIFSLRLSISRNFDFSLEMGVKTPRWHRVVFSMKKWKETRDLTSASLKDFRLECWEPVISLWQGFVPRQSDECYQQVVLNERRL